MDERLWRSSEGDIGLTHVVRHLLNSSEFTEHVLEPSLIFEITIGTNHPSNPFEFSIGAINPIVDPFQPVELVLDQELPDKPR